MKAYIVFNCPVGAATWNIATNKARASEVDEDFCLPAFFHKRETAETFCSDVVSKRKAWMNGKPDQVNWDTFIAEVDLPDREAERIAVKAAYDARPRS